MTDEIMLTIDGVSAGYGQLITIRDISIEVPRGRTVTIIGPNGAGKSTLLKAIYGQAVVRNGAITLHVDGRDRRLDGLPGNAVTRLGVNFVPQRQNVFPTLSVEENLEIGGIVAGRRARARMTEIYDLYPKLAQRRRQHAGTLSGGERQLLAMGRALMTEPAVLLLDEPTAALSPVATAEMFDQISAVRELGVSMLMVEQNARQALAITDYAYVLESGRTVLDGTGYELLEDPRVESLYLGGHVDAQSDQDL